MADERSGNDLMEKPVIFDFPSALRSQAVVRLSLASVSIAAWLVTTHLLGLERLAVLVLGGVHLGYAAAMLLVARLPRERLRPWMGYLTATLDPLVLTGWAVVMGRAAVLIAPLYVFSAIGYGLRTGNKRMMLISQGVSLLALAGLPFVAVFWREHLLIWASCVISIVAIPGYVGVLMDQLHQAIRFAEYESRAKSDLLARTSHELRTPLGGISNAAELLLHESEPERRRTLASTVLTLSGHLLADINDLLDQSKLSLGRVEMAATPLSLRQQLDVVRAAVESNASARGVAFLSVIDPRLSDHVVGDAHWLSRVLINLCGNAVKFTEFGSITLNVTLLQEQAEWYLIRFSVKDTGVGIPKPQQERIFDPFVQLLGARRPQGAGGVGLGLAISKQAVELMGGSLRVHSEIGMGSTFWFDLRMPRAIVPVDPRDDPESVLPAVQTQPQRRLLVVDDNETNRYLLQELLRREGHHVTTAASGEQALEILGEARAFDLLLLDYNLGGMDGSMLLQTYRFGTRKPAPAYFLTADATLVTTSKLRDTGALGVLTKPVRLRELRHAIEAACSGAGQAARPAGDEEAVRTAAAAASSASPVQLRPVPVVFVDMAVIDRLKQIGTRQLFLKELLERAVADIEASTLRILDALGESDLKSARDAGHALKGVCMETGAMRLMNMALGLMRTEDAYLLDNRVRIAADLRDTSARTREALRGIVAESMEQAAGF